jgi:hypothetical protein
MEDTEVPSRARREPDPELDRLAHAVIGAAIEVHRALGPGLLEAVYESALRIELEQRAIPFVRQPTAFSAIAVSRLAKGASNFSLAADWWSN